MDTLLGFLLDQPIGMIGQDRLRHAWIAQYLAGAISSTRQIHILLSSEEEVWMWSARHAVEMHAPSPG